MATRSSPRPGQLEHGRRRRFRGRHRPAAQHRRVRRTSWLTSEAFQSLQAAGPVAAASAMVSQCSSSSSEAESPMAVVTIAIVDGSSRSRRVAVSGSSR